MQSSLPRTRVVAAAAAIALAAAASVADAQTFIGNNFTASNIGESGFIPPDTMGTVGPNHVVLMINGKYKVFAKNSAGATVAGAANNTSLNGFWDNLAVGRTNTSFDPRIMYDRFSQRFFAVSVEGSTPATNQYLVAVSNTSDPTAGWGGFRFTGNPGGAAGWSDFPMLGYDANNVYITANMFSGAASGQLVAIPKADLLLGTPTVANRYTNIIIGSNRHTPQVLDNTGGNYALLAPALSSITRNVVTGTAPAIVVGGNASTTTVSYGSASNARQPDGTANLEVNGSRYFAAPVRIGNSYFTVQTVNPGGGNNAGLRWLELNATTFAVIREGLITSPGMDYYYGAITANPNGDVVVGFSGSGPGAGAFASAYAAVVVQAGTTVASPAITLLKAGTASYFQDFGTGRNRWGDYSATQVDPADPQIFWTFQEWASGTTSWSINASEVIVPRAGETRWANAANGTYSVAGNWYGGAAPSGAGRVVFSRTGTFTTTFTAAAATDRLRVHQGTVTFDLSTAGGPFTLLNSSTSDPSLAVAEFQGTARLNISRGTVSAQDVWIAPGLGGNGTLSVGGTSFSTLSASNIYIAGTNLAAANSTGRFETTANSIVVVTGAISAWSGGTIAITAGSVSAGSVVVRSGAALTQAGSLSASGNSTNDGTITQSAGTSNLGLLSGTGSTTVNAGTFNAKAVRQNALTLGGTAVVNLTDSPGGIAGDTVLTTSIGTGSTSILNTLSIAGPVATPTAKLDIRNNDVVIRTGATIDNIRQRVAYAFNAGAWDRAGITSGRAASEGLAVGFSANADLAYTQFSGVAVTTTDFLLKYTWFGDADLNGQVDGDDYLLWLAVFGSSGTGIGWAQGDFDYDADVDGDDYLLWLQNFGNGIGTPLAAVPEPGVLGLATVAAAGLLARRRRAMR